MNRIVLTTVLSLGLVPLYVGKLAAQRRPDFSGHWVLKPAESRMIGPGGQSGPAQLGERQMTWLVTHRDPHIAVTVNVRDPDRPHEFSFQCTTDGRKCVNELPELREVREMSAQWSGADLLMTQQARTPYGSFNAEDRLSLADSGRTLVFDRVVRDQRGKRSVRQVFRKLGAHPTPGATAPLASTDSLPPTVLLPLDLARVLTDYEIAYPKGGAAIAALFVEDGFVLAGGRPPVRGRPAIAEYYGTSRGSLALRAFAFGIGGSTAFILGGYSARRGEPDGGKFTLTLRRGSDGRWSIVSDMDNANSRPPRPRG